ncbi:MAG: hypothetical protein ACK4S4_15815 [Pyrinomonadaceae bacterium]
MSEIAIEGLSALETDLNRLPQAFNAIHARFSHAAAGSWKKWIIEVDALDTRRLLFSVAAHAAGVVTEAKQFVIDTSRNSRVMYSDIVERGRKDGNYAKGKPYTDAYGGRYPAGRALEQMYETDALEGIATRTLSEFLHG